MQIWVEKLGIRSKNRSLSHTIAGNPYRWKPPDLEIGFKMLPKKLRRKSMFDYTTNVAGKTWEDTDGNSDAMRKPGTDGWWCRVEVKVMKTVVVV